MHTLDLIFLGVLFASFLLGAWRGLIYEVLSVVNWMAAFVLAQWFAPDVALKLPLSSSGEAIRYAAGFALVFVLSVFAGGLLIRLIQKIFAAAGLLPIDRALGAAFGLLRGVVLLLAVTVVIGMSPMKSSAWWTESVGAGMTMASIKGLKPVLPQEFGRYLPS